MWKATAYGRGCRCVVAVDLKWQLHLFSFFYEFCTSNISMVRISFSLLLQWWSPFLHQLFILRGVAIVFSKSLNFRGAIHFFICKHGHKVGFDKVKEVVYLRVCLTPIWRGLAESLYVTFRLWLNISRIPLHFGLCALLLPDSSSPLSQLNKNMLIERIWHHRTGHWFLTGHIFSSECWKGPPTY